jgi:methionine synthase I (cobalamin-dependent)
VEAIKCNDYLNVESPAIVLDVHTAYLAAGSHAVLTNTFGANKYALARHGLGEMTEKINVAGAEIARRAAGGDRYVLGDIGPTGDFLEPLGALKPDGLRDAFADQATALLAGGADGLLIETMSALDEITIAIEAAKAVSDLPVFASMAFEYSAGDFKTMMGVDVETALSKIMPLGVDAVGFNCGTASLDRYIDLARRFVAAVKAAGSELPILAEPNAGKPRLVEGKATYTVSPAEFAEAAGKIRAAGVSIIGGCCGTTPAHIEAVANRLK